MATCKLCDKSSWLLRVSQDGVCYKCEAIQSQMIGRKVQIIRESADLVETGKTLKTRLGRCDDIIRIASELIDYEQRGIQTTDPPPSRLIDEFRVEKDNILIEHAREEVRKTLARAELRTTPRTQITEASKAILKIQDIRKEYGLDVPVLGELETNARRFMHRAELQGFLTEAEKAEFKGNKKKALDQYQEALFFLQRDDIDDRLQKNQIGDVEAKVRELSEEVGE
ncbi:MAG: hypothetical protein V3T35_13880 [Spirochaetia bacterium]